MEGRTEDGAGEESAAEQKSTSTSTSEGKSTTKSKGKSKTAADAKDDSKTASKPAPKPAPKTDAKATPDQKKPQPAGPSALSEVPEQTWGALRALHPRQALLTALVIASAAYASGRSLKEAGVAGAAMFLAQAILGLLNDARDEAADRSAAVEGKPVAEGNLPAGNATYFATLLGILAVPVAAMNGWIAAGALAAYLVLGMLSLTPLRRSALSWLPWALSFAALPAFLSYGGWGPSAEGSPPTWQITVAAAALGVGVHFALTLSHLVADNKTRTRHLPLRIALRIGAGPLLVVTVLYVIVAVAAVVYTASAYGLRQ